MSGLSHLYPHPRRPDELIRAQRWNAVTYALAGYRDSTKPADRRYFRQLALFEIRTWKRREAAR